MLRRVLASSRYIVLIAVVGTFVASCVLLVYEALVVAQAVVRIIGEGEISPQGAKVIAIGLIEAVDVFLIAIAVYIISLGLYALFIDDKLPLPRWLEVHDLEDLKANLVSIVIAVLAVLFLREAVAWDGERDLLKFGAVLGLIIAALTFFLYLKKKWQRD
ncbi:MAG TPA: YqhA family protein [Burkholderiales bacterium]|nr:YqhA family protein [Betaproteobacteria bacterium]HQR52722.1 YqhA family protein [Burkholderiales bacterium]